MGASVPNGTQFAIAATYAAATPITALSNAAPPVATAAGHTLLNGDIGVVESGWLYLNDRPARVIAEASGVFSLENFDTTNTIKNSPGQGAGTFAKVLTWMPLSQTTKTASSGGDQNYVKWTYLEDGQERSKPTFKNAKILTMTFADDPTLAFYPTLVAADAAGTGHILRATLASGGFLYYNVYVSFDAEPTLDINEISTVTASFSQVGPLIRYLS